MVYVQLTYTDGIKCTSKSISYNNNLPRPTAISITVAEATKIFLPSSAEARLDVLLIRANYLRFIYWGGYEQFLCIGLLRFQFYARFSTKISPISIWHVVMPDSIPCCNILSAKQRLSNVFSEVYVSNIPRLVAYQRTRNSYLVQLSLSISGVQFVIVDVSILRQLEGNLIASV